MYSASCIQALNRQKKRMISMSEDYIVKKLEISLKGAMINNLKHLNYYCKHLHYYLY